MAVQDPKKLKLRGQVPQDACQKRSKFDLQETPRRPQMKTLYHVPKNIDVGYCLEAPRQAFGDQNGRLWNTCGRTSAIESSSSIFEGCTVRFAWFCDRRHLLFAPRNRPKEHVFTCCTKPLSENPKGGPRSLQKGPSGAPETPRKGFRNRSPKKVTFCAASSPGGLLSARPGPWKWDHDYI